MKKLYIVTLLFVLLFTACADFVGTPEDIFARERAIAESAYSTGKNPVIPPAGFVTYDVATPATSFITVTFAVPYNPSTITPANVKLFAVTTAATMNAPAGTLLDLNITSNNIELIDAKTIKINFNSTGATNGHILQLSHTVGFLGGLHAFNGNLNQYKGEVADEFISLQLSTTPAINAGKYRQRIVSQAEGSAKYLLTGYKSIDEDGKISATPDFYEGATSMLIVDKVNALNFEPSTTYMPGYNLANNFSLQWFNFEIHRWQKVPNMTATVVKRTDAAKEPLYNVVLKGIAPNLVTEKARFRLVIAHPENIMYKMPALGISSVAGEVGGQWLITGEPVAAAFITPVVPLSKTKFADFTQNIVTDSSNSLLPVVQLEFSVVNIGLYGYLKILTKAITDPAKQAIAAKIEADLLNGIRTGAITAYGADTLANLPLTISTVPHSTVKDPTTGSVYKLYQITNHLFNPTGMATITFYAKNTFTMTSGFANMPPVVNPAVPFADMVHPFIDYYFGEAAFETPFNRGSTQIFIAAVAKPAP